MPLILDIVKPHFQLKAWHITEDVSFFEEKISLYDSEKEILNKIQRDTRKLQWLSARYILKELTNLQKD